MDDQSRPLLSFCFNADDDIWEQDLWNKQLFNRVHDVLAQRTNQVFPIPEPTMDEVCLFRTQSEQNNLNQECNNNHQGYLKPLTQIPLRPDDTPVLASTYNSHYKMAYPPHQMTNLRTIETESDLFFTMNTPYNQDCLDENDVERLKSGHMESNRQIYRKYHKNEVNASIYPNTDRTIFDNVTKEIYNTIDDRNRFILYST